MLFAPIGFNWQISIALVPGLAAREVAVGALGTVYALSATGDGRERRVDPVDRAVVEPADGAVAARLVRVRAAVPVDPGDREARNQFMALSADHGRRICSRCPTSPPSSPIGRRWPRGWADVLLQWAVVSAVVAVSVAYSAWRLLGVRQRLWLLERLLPMARRAHVGWPARLKAGLQAQALKGCGSCGANAAAAPTRRSGAPPR